MTALTKYAKLESIGLWRPPSSEEGREEQRREVVICFGEASLIIRDQANRPLAHWSLAAIERVNAGTTPAVFAPDSEHSETLEVEDDIMTDAIETVRKSIDKQRPKPGRLRGVGFLLTAAAVVGLGVFWLPDALRNQAISALPETKRQEIGTALLGHMQRLTGSSCRTPRGNQALGRLVSRTLGADSEMRAVIVPQGVKDTKVLPGKIIVINKSLVEDFEDPAVPAGFILAANTARETRDPLADVLKTAGLQATFRVLTTGDLPSEVLRDYAEATIADPNPPVSTGALIEAFEAAQISSKPFAYAVDKTGETTLELIEADSISPVDAPVVLNDTDWVALQGICGS